MWTGFYVGLNIGGGWSANSNNNSYLPYSDTTYGIGSTPFPGASPNLFFLPGGGQTNSNTGGVVGGGQIGYNYQINQFVIGAEADIQGTSISGGNQGNYAGLYTSPYPRSATGLLTPLVTGNGGNLSLPWFGTVRGRAGYLVTPTLLLYGTAGFAYGGVDAFQRDQHQHRLDGWRRRRVAVRPALVGEGRISLCRPRQQRHQRRHHRLAVGQQPSSAAQRRARWRELSLQLRRAGSGRRQVLIGGKPVLKKPGLRGRAFLSLKIQKNKPGLRGRAFFAWIPK